MSLVVDDVIIHAMALVRVASGHSRRVLAMAVDAVLVGTRKLVLKWQELVLALELFHLLLDSLVVVEEVLWRLWRTIPCLCGLQAVVAHHSLESC